MPDLVGVHGISQQQLGRHQLIEEWQPALRDGIEQAAGRPGPQPSFDLAFYGDFYLPLAGQDTKGGVNGAPTNDPIAELETLTGEALDFLQEAAEEVTERAERSQATTAAKGPLLRLPARLHKTAAWLDERFGLAGTLLFFHDLRQVQRYLTDAELAGQVQARVREAVGAGCLALIGHSLGSVVAYETVCLYPDLPMRVLVTLGSPLGLRTVRTRLRALDATGRPTIPVPGRLQAWTNVYDPHDPVACAGGLADIWPRVVDRTVANQDRPHAIRRYLGKRATGQAIMQALDGR